MYNNIQSDEIGKMELFVDMFRQTEVVPMTDIALPPQKRVRVKTYNLESLHMNLKPCSKQALLICTLKLR